MMVLVCCAALSLGCGTKFNRVATEQMLLSDAVDRAIGGIDFSPLSGQKVFLETKYIEAARVQNLVNAEYVISSMRHQLTIANCTLQVEKKDADIVVEPRIGALGSDGHETVFGIPSTDAGRAAGAFSGNLLPLALLPELSVGRNNAQSAVAKIVVFAYDQKTAEPIWQSGVAKAESTSKDTWIFGAGPFQKGSIHDGVRFEGREIESLPIAKFSRNKDEDKPEPLKIETATSFSSLPKMVPNESVEHNEEKSTVIQAGHQEASDNNK
jgi:hypothetical protein